MTIKASGSLSMSEINAEFGLGNNLGAYRGVAWWTDTNSTGTFSSTNLGFGEFYNKRKNTPVVADSTTYSSPGSYNFIVPLYNTLTVQVWGGGGGGGSGFDAVVVNGASGGQSKWNNTVIANGGSGSNLRNGGAGGTASGGTTNTSGSSGGFGGSGTGQSSGSGGASPNGGATRAGVLFNGTSQNGLPGNAPGGGGTGGMTNTGGGGGGGGGYSSRTYSAGELAVGASIPLTVGSGGAGGVNPGSGGVPGTTGGAGASGRVLISWN